MGVHSNNLLIALSPWTYARLPPKLTRPFTVQGECYGSSIPLTDPTTIHRLSHPRDRRDGDGRGPGICPKAETRLLSLPVSALQR